MISSRYRQTKSAAHPKPRCLLLCNPLKCSASIAPPETGFSPNSDRREIEVEIVCRGHRFQPLKISPTARNNYRVTGDNWLKEKYLGTLSYRADWRE
jgi:hypothetical protein